MSAGDVLLVVAATVLVLLVAVLAATLVALTATLRDLRKTANALHDEAIPLLVAARDAVNEAAVEVERVERLVSSAELVSGALDSASRITAKTLRSPVVKAMAFGTGVSRAAQRMRDGDAPPPKPKPVPQPQAQPSARRRRRATKRAS